MDLFSIFADPMAFIEVWGYLGLFIIELVSAASIIFPAPAFAVNFLLGAVPGFNPWIIGMVAGTAGANSKLEGLSVEASAFIAAELIAFHVHGKYTRAFNLLRQGPCPTNNCPPIPS